MAKLSEKKIERQILDYFNRQKGCKLYKLNNVGIWDETKKIHRKLTNPHTPKGLPDIFGSFYSRATYIEVKTPDEYQYLARHYDELRKYFGPSKKKTHLREQIHFIEDNQKQENIAFFADSIARVKSELLRVYNGGQDEQANS